MPAPSSRRLDRDELDLEVQRLVRTDCATGSPFTVAKRGGAIVRHLRRRDDGDSPGAHTPRGVVPVDYGENVKLSRRLGNLNFSI